MFDFYQGGVKAASPLGKKRGGKIKKERQVGAAVG